jgi:hypothetical protein
VSFDPGAALGEIAAALTTIAAVLVAWWRRRSRHSRERSAPRALAARRTQIGILQGLALEIGAARASLILAHNGGKTIDPGSALAVTVLGESHAPSLSPQASEYQGRALTDAHHLELLTELDRDRLITRAITDLPEGSSLRDEMIRDDLGAVWWSLVCRDARGMYYLQAATRGETFDEPSTRAALRTCAARLASSICGPGVTGGHPSVRWP